MSSEQQALLMISNSTGPVPVQTCIGDPYYSCTNTSPRTVFSWHAEDTTDTSCYIPKTITLTGTASLSSAQKKYGEKSLLVPNTGTSTLNGAVVTDDADFDFGTSDFSIDFWAYRNANTYTGYLFQGAVSGNAFYAYVGTAGTIYVQWASSAGVSLQQQIATFPLAQWVHVLLQRNGNFFEFYLNGAYVVSAYVASASTFNFSSDFYIGRPNTTSAQTWNGYIDDFRITKGIARQNSGYPAVSDIVPTAQYPDGSSDPYWNNVDLLIHGNSFTDSSSNNRTLSLAAGGPAGIDTSIYKYGTGSFYNTSGSPYYFYYQYTSTNINSSLFTFECWFYRTGTGNYSGFIYGSTSGAGVILKTSGAYEVSITSSINIRATSASVTPLNQWCHIAVSCDGFVSRIFFNGVLEAAINETMFLPTETVFQLGRTDTAGFSGLLGRVADFRFTRGVCRYTRSFTPPTLTFCEAVSSGFDAGTTVNLIGQTATALKGTVATTGNQTTLSGTAISARQGSLSAAPYPDLARTSTTYPSATGSVPFAVYFRLCSDGSVKTLNVTVDSSWLSIGYWIDASNPYFSIPNIVNQYNYSVIDFGATTTVSYPSGINYVGDTVIMITMFAPIGSAVYDTQINVTPKPTNPRYGDPSYKGWERFKITVGGLI